MMFLFPRKKDDTALTPPEPQLAPAEELQRPEDKPKTKKGGLALVIGAGAAAIVTPLVQKWEGVEHDPYRDIVGVWTVCYGDTSNVGPSTPTQTPEQCLERLEVQLIAHAEPVLQCVPQLKDHSWQLAAAVSLTYNIGPKGFCQSTLAQQFRDGKWISACDGFAAWRKAGGRVVQGLVNRRAEERLICLTEVPREFAR